MIEFIITYNLDPYRNRQFVHLSIKSPTLTMNALQYQRIASIEFQSHDASLVVCLEHHFIMFNCFQFWVLNSLIYMSNIFPNLWVIRLFLAYLLPWQLDTKLHRIIHTIFSIKYDLNWLRRNTWSPGMPLVTRRVIIPQSECAEAPNISSSRDLKSPEFKIMSRLSTRLHPSTWRRNVWDHT